MRSIAQRSLFVLILLLYALLLMPAQAQSGGKAALRFKCEGASVGAAVSINGQFKGECPFYSSVSEGTLKIRAVKQAGPEHEQVFEQEVRVGADSVKDIEVVLGAKQLTAEGKRLREERAAAERRAQAEREEQARREEEARQAELRRRETERAAQFERQRVAAQGGDAEAMAVLAEAYEEGKNGVERDRKQAFAWYQKAAQAGSVVGMGGLGAMYFNGWGVVHDYLQAEQWWRRAAQAGNGRAMNGLHWLYMNGVGGLPQDVVEGLRWLTAASDAGYGNAQRRLGSLLLDGNGVAKDTVKGMALLKQASQQGVPEAFLNIGYAYFMGNGVPKSDEQALHWYQQGAEVGCGICVYNIAAFQSVGAAGLTKGDMETVKLIRRAAEMGALPAIKKMAARSLEGVGMPRDPTAALQWFRKAAELGDAEAEGAVYRLEAMQGLRPEGEARGLSCFALIVGATVADGAIFSPVWQNAQPDKSETTQQLTLAQFGAAMREAAPQRWNEFGEASQVECVAGFCHLSANKLFGAKHTIQQWCHPVSEVVQRKRASLMRAEMETTDWIPAGARPR